MLNEQLASRTFQLWEYRVSHSSLLIRSPRVSGFETNVDIVCIDVLYIAAPQTLRGIELAEPTAEEVLNLERILGTEISSSSVLILVSNGNRFPIVASRFIIDENERELFVSRFQ